MEGQVCGAETVCVEEEKMLIRNEHMSSSTEVTVITSHLLLHRHAIGTWLKRLKVKKQNKTKERSSTSSLPG